MTMIDLCCICLLLFAGASGVGKTSILQVCNKLNKIKNKKALTKLEEIPSLVNMLSSYSQPSFIDYLKYLQHKINDFSLLNYEQGVSTSKIHPFFIKQKLLNELWLPTQQIKICLKKYQKINCTKDPLLCIWLKTESTFILVEPAFCKRRDKL